MRRILLGVLLGTAACAAVACSGSDDGPGTAPTSSTDASADTAAPPSPPPPDGGGNDAAKDAAPAHALSIKFDYRFDSAGFFASADRRKALEAAGTIWSQLLKDQFGRVPKGTYAITRNPETYADPAQPVTLEEDIEGILVFVGSAAFPDTPHARSASTAGTSQVADPVLAKELRDRYDGPDHEPWTGWISFNRNDPWYFDATPAANGVVPADKVDFVSVALHEMGHVLGIGGSNAWKAFVEGDFFVGPNAVKLYGAKVPLTPDHGHLPLNFRFDGKEVLMDVASAKGERSFPTKLDLALLQDIGYEL